MKFCLVLLLNLSFSLHLFASETSSLLSIEKVLNLLEKKTIQVDSCHMEDEEFRMEVPANRCQGFVESSLPKDYKDQGWKTIVEIKYNPILDDGNMTLNWAQSHQELIKEYEITWGKVNVTSEADADAKSARISAWLKGHKIISDPFVIKSNLLLNSLSNESLYRGLTTLEEKNKKIYDMLDEFTKNMSDADYLKFISATSGYVGYNKERQKLKQNSSAGKGIVNAFEQITHTKAGVCGDIHSIAAKLGEKRNWEAFTVGYAVSGSQHVVTAMKNPKDPNKIMIVNYGSYEQHEVNPNDWTNPTPTKTSEDVGFQLRIFKNDKTGDNEGKMQQIATIPTALGSFMSDLFKKESQISKSMPLNPEFQVKKMGLEKNRYTVEANPNNDSILQTKEVEDVMVYEGLTNKERIYGVAVSANKFKNFYQWDPDLKKCYLIKNKYSSVGLATNYVNNIENNRGSFHMYLNMKGGVVKNLFHTDHFKFQGLLGYEWEGMLNINRRGNAVIDGNITTLLGIGSEYEKGNTAIRSGITYEANVGFRNQNLITDLGSIPSNVNPLSFNAISFDSSLKQKINPHVTIIANSNLTLTRVGSRVFFSSGILYKDKTRFGLSYQDGIASPIHLGNSLKESNLIGGLGSARIEAERSFSNRSRSLSGKVSAYGGVTTEKSKPIAGTTIKLNLTNPKKKARQP